MNTTVQVVQHLCPGGIETLALDLLSSENGDTRNYIVSLEGTAEASLDKWPRLQHYKDNLIFMNKKPGLQPALFASLYQTFLALNATTIHTHHIGPLFYAGILSRIMSIKSLIHTEHDTWHLDDRRMRNLQRWILQLSKPTLVADAKTVASNLEKKLGIKNITVIRNGIDTTRFLPGSSAKAREKLSLPSLNPLIGCAGRLEPIKGHKYLLQAVALLPKNIHLAIAGEGSEKKSLQMQAKTLGIKDRVHFLGLLNKMEIFYQALDAFCLPSLNEGFPLSPLEAQACGIRAVVTNVGGSHETVCPQTGTLVEKENPEALALSLLRILKLPKSHLPREFAYHQSDLSLMKNAYRKLIANS